MTQEKYKIIKTKCPVLNLDSRIKFFGGSPDLEVLVKIELGQPIGVICPRYKDNGLCECDLLKTDKFSFSKGYWSIKGNCIYATGWRDLRV